MNSIINNVVKLYLDEYDSVFDMVVDVVTYQEEGYVVYCYDENGELIVTGEDVK